MARMPWGPIDPKNTKLIPIKLDGSCIGASNLVEAFETASQLCRVVKCPIVLLFNGFELIVYGKSTLREIELAYQLAISSEKRA